VTKTDTQTPRVESPYLTAQEAAEYLRFPSAHAFRMAIDKFGIPYIQRGRQLFFTKPQLDEFMSVASDATNPTRPSRRTRGKAA
jgi:excisionase family DNA binding protein